MDLSTGASLGPYQIVSPLGAGGMGRVFKARDTRLDRTVAIKILSDSLAGDPQFRARFDREARVISQLDHPHICTLYDVGQQDGTAYLVMQYLDGETLASRLERGPLPVDEAIGCAVQLADALARAHRAGIVHRDLKPGNVMLTRSGAKLLDFGLAKSAPATHSQVAAASLPTTPAGLTAQGTLLGTFHYMAPEQIEGAEADARSDIWAFGCVLYEMLAGARPFDGRSAARLLVGILNTEPPPLRERQPLLPDAVDDIVRGCLEKDPDARWQAMGDVARQLRWVARARADASGPGAPPRSVWRRHALLAGLLSALLVAITLAALSRRSPAPADSHSAPPLRLTFVPPAGLSLTPFGSAGTPHFALSPDGQRIAFVAAAAGRAPSLWVRRLDSRGVQEIPDSADASSPFWAPNGESLGFFAEGRLKTIALQGERPTVVATVIDAAGGTWHGDVILVGRGNGPIARVPATGGQMRNVTTLRPDGGGHRWPQFLPDGKRFIYTESRGSVMLGTLDSGKPRALLGTRSTAVSAGPAFLLYVQSSRLMAQAIDPVSFQPTGAPREGFDEVRYAVGSGFPPVSVSANGLLAYWDGITVSTELAWFDRSGNRLSTRHVPEEGYDIAISPRTDQVAFTRRGTGSVPAIWLMDASGAASRFSFSPAGATRPVWSADGSALWFTSIDDGQTVLLRRGASAAEKEQVVGKVPRTGAEVGGLGNYTATDWSNDGRMALVSITSPVTGRDIVAFSVADQKMTPLFHSDAYEVQARFSPDNHWISYASNETGRMEVFVEPFPPSGPRWQVSSNGGSQPVWRRDGRELFFLGPDGKLMVAAVHRTGAFVHGPPQPLFQTRMRPPYPPYPVNYDVTADGQRFLIDGVRPDTGPNVSIIVNWTAATGFDRR